jgi:hypothetical protein
MNRYIVTEEKIQKWVELDYSAKDCRNEVKEHLYNPQVELRRVLDELEKSLREYECVRFVDVMCEMEKLRQSKDGEQNEL